MSATSKSGGASGDGGCTSRGGAKHKRQLTLIEPNKCIVEDLEILAFESEEQLNYYTVWHEALVDKRRELNAESDRERQIIRNEIARKTCQLIGAVGDAQDLKRQANSSRSASKSSKSPKSTTKCPVPPISSPRRPIQAVTSSALAASRRAVSAALAFRPNSGSNQSAQTAASHQRQGSASLPNGLTILNSAHFHTLPPPKQMMKYKLTKLYNKYRGRQMRRNFVQEKQLNTKIEAEISKSYLNPWLAYTALQALRLPEPHYNALSTITTGTNGTILTPIAQPITQVAPSKKSKSSSKKQQFKAPAPVNQGPQKAPLHLVYIDPGNIITYSNRINPQQVADYRRKSHLLPSSATSKKSSAASYDVYEIMEVLANTNKTNVTITRNASRPSQAGTSTTSIYSHSVNANTPGIVSTQLHLQARSYLESMGNFYSDERARLISEDEAMKKEPSPEEIMAKYLNIDHTYTQPPTGSPSYEANGNGGLCLNSSGTSYNSDAERKDPEDESSDFDDEIDRLEEEILTMLKPKDDCNSQVPT